MLSLASIASPHALLVAHWGKEGGAVLSLPTKEYFQSSGWVEERPPPSQPREPESRFGTPFPQNVSEVRSVRSGSEFWADGRSRTPSSHAFTASGSHYIPDTADENEKRHHYHRARSHTRQGQGTNESSQYTTTTTTEEDDNDSQGTEMPGGDQDADDGIVDEVGAQDAFIAGMIFALSRRLCPGLPYTPAWSGEDVDGANGEDARGRWRLDECLRYFLLPRVSKKMILSGILFFRFATELSGRKARRSGWTGLAEETIQAGWFDG